MVFDHLIQQIKKVDPQKNYWFVRTDSGAYFDTYTKNDFIGIGWNYVTVEDLKKLDDTQLKQKIAAAENADLSIAKQKGKVTGILTKLKRFEELKKGDVVVIPSNSSSRYAFGIVEDSHTFIEHDNKHNCQYYKRKKVKWITTKHVDELDPIFYQIKITRHAISDIKDYENYIDSVINHLYIKDGFGHYVLDITTRKDINVRSLLALIDSIQDLTQKVNEYFDLNEDTESSSIKLNIQSPGKIEFKFPTGKSLVLVAAILSLASGCAPDQIHATQQETADLTEFSVINKDTIATLQAQMDTLEVDKNKINSFK